DPRDILQAYRMVAEDRGWLSRINEAILQGLTAEAAVRHVQDGIRNRLRQVSDPYLRERLADFEDLANRLIQHLAGVGPGQYGIAPNEDFILIARNMGPGELFDYDRSRLKGLVLEEGGPSSHVALIAKALEIPVVGRCIGALDAIEPLDRILVDADNGQVFVRPTADIQAAFIETINSHDKRCARYRHSRYMPSVSLDGIRIELMLNAGLLIDLKHLADTDADGIGLYRTEIPFMVRGSFPDVRDQTELYAQAFDYAGEKPVIFRTLDVGGDKNLPYLRVPGEDNPALGWRGVRILLDRPAVLRQQLRAMIRAAAGHDLNVMFPMVGETFELAAAHHILDLELSRESERGSKMPRKIRVGVMLEVPSLLFQLDSLCSKVDFISIGSNDLLQYMFAADRGNPRIEGRFDTLSPAFLRALRNAADACRKHDVDLSLCGEMAGRPLEAMALIGIGITSLSMAPQSIGPVREMVRSLDAAPLAAWMERRLETASDSLREELAGFARDHNVAMQAIADSPINLV
ncbi:MAG: phosphoenolpyruvate--protein phosphotransferase, partial [Pseudomonadota bacterium]|nr:phosphoenolpyruvate--protein phosphotransferase [Pseudomonadota bacterium]